MTTLPQPVPTPLTIDPALLDPNPYQPLSRVTFTPDQLADLISVKDLGFIQKPQVRMHSTQPGRYQIKVGHRRIAAWQLYRPGEPVPVDLIGADDRAMFEHMIVENLRTDPTSVERAQMIRDYMQRFGVTQAQAGQLFGLRTQGSVSNLLSLLDLPVEIQALLASGSLPERFARRFKPLRSLNADKDLIKIARDVAAIDDQTGDALTGGTQESTLTRAITELLQSKARYISGAPWPTAWHPDQPADVGDGKEDLPACETCPFNRKINFQPYCLRPACYKAKFAVWAGQATAKAAKARHIPAAQPGEKVRRIDDVDLARRLLAGKPAEHLRLLPVAESDSRDYGARSYRKALTGSELTAVGVLESQADAVIKALPVAKKKTPAASSPTRSAADYTRQHNERQRAFDASKKTMLEVFERLSPIVAARLPADPVALSLLADLVLQDYGATQFPLDQKIQREFDQQQTITAKPGELRLYLAHQIFRNIDDLTYDNPAKGLQQTRDALAKLAARHKLTFPAGWDAALLPPPSPVEGKTKPATGRKRKS